MAMELKVKQVYEIHLPLIYEPYQNLAHGSAKFKNDLLVKG